LRASLEASLRRLRTDHVDLFQLHNAGAETLRSLDGLSELIDRLKSEGKIRAFGISTPAPDDALALLDVPGVACFQVNCNLLDWRAVDIGLFDRAVRAGVAIVARTPLAFGFIAGRLAPDTRFDPADHRSRWSRERIVAWNDAADDIFASIGRGRTAVERVTIALQFCLAFDAVATVIPGMTTPAEVETNAAAASGRLDSNDIALMASAYRRHEGTLRMAGA